MTILDLLHDFDAALDWQADDPFLDEHEPPSAVPASPWVATAD